MPTVISGTSLNALTTVGWGVMSLFANNEAGVWFDPSDMSTMFQNANGTTPVTAMEQPVGLILDKSKGLALGPELVTNGDFSNGSTGWSLSSASVVGGAIVLSGDPTIIQSLSTVSGKTYIVSITVSNLTNGTSLWFRFTGGTASNSSPFSNGINTFFLRSNGNTGILIEKYSGTITSGSIDNITVKEVPGNHAFQSTSTSRPILSARYNVFEFTQAFDSAYWIKSSVTITPNTSETTDPFGGNTADKYTATNVDSGIIKSDIITAGTWTLSIYFKAGTHSNVAMLVTTAGNGRIANYNLSSKTSSITNQGTGGTVSGGTAELTELSNGWFLCQIKNITVSSTNTFICGGNGINGEIFYLWGADLRVANDGVNLPPYQRVNTSTEYDSNGFPAYLKFDGVDDILLTNTINLGAVDKAQVFVGVRKLSDSIDRALLDYGPSWAGVNGSFGLYAPSYITGGLPAPKYFIGVRSSSGSIRQVDFSTYSAPITNTLSVAFDINAEPVSEITTRINATNVSPSISNGDAGAGNFNSWNLAIGGYGGFGGFNGHLYNLIVRFSATNLEIPFIQATEAYINSKTKAY